MCEKAIDFLKRYVKDWLNLDGKEEADRDKVQEHGVSHCIHHEKREEVLGQI